MSAAVSAVGSNPRFAQIALIDTDDELSEFLRVCLFQMGIETLSFKGTDDLNSRKFEGCVVDLRSRDAEAILEALRNSPRNRRTVLLGVYSDLGELRRYSRYGINALIRWPSKQADAIKVLRSTKTLIVHELRRYARIPLATEVELTIKQHKLRGVTREISSGGMSVHLKTLPDIRSQKGEVVLLFPTGKTVRTRGLVSWVHQPENLVGVQFVPDAEALKPIRSWIDEYLGIV